MSILCLTSEKGKYCIFAKLNKVNFEKKKKIPLKTGNTVVNQQIRDSMTHRLRDSGFFLNHFKIPFCLDVLIVPFVTTFFFLDL